MVEFTTGIIILFYIPYLTPSILGKANKYKYIYTYTYVYEL